MTLIREKSAWRPSSLLCRFHPLGRPEWARFLGGAILGIVALVLITPLRLRLHEQPLPLDVAPQRDVLGGIVRRETPTAIDERSSPSTRQREPI